MSAIFTPTAPAPVGPYSQAISRGGMVFCSGQVAIDPATKKLIDGDISAQSRRAIENLGEVLRAAHLSFNDVVKTTVFLTDMAHFAALNAVYAEFFDTVKPARSTIAVAGLPLGGLIEIEAIAIPRPDPIP